MTIRCHPHALARMEERGTSEEEVIETVENGERFAAKFGRIGFRRNFAFGEKWRGKQFNIKQVEAYAVQEGTDWIVITVSPVTFERKRRELAMRFTYDPRYNVAYISFQEKRAEMETIRVSDELAVDLAPDGTVYGIELLNANQQLQREHMGKLLVINEATGERTELPLAVR